MDCNNIHVKFNNPIKANQYLVKYQSHYYSINSSSDTFYLYYGDVQRPFRSLSLVFKTPRVLLWTDRWLAHNDSLDQSKVALWCSCLCLPNHAPFKACLWAGLGICINSKLSIKTWVFFCQVNPLWMDQFELIRVLKTRGAAWPRGWEGWEIKDWRFQ